MVDFNNETTITTAPKNVLSIIALQHYTNILEAIESYNNKKFIGVELEPNYLQSRMLTLYYQFKPSIMVFYSKTPGVLEKFKRLEFVSLSFEELINIFNALNNYLYEKKIIKLDDFKKYDSTNPFEENRAGGFY